MDYELKSAEIACEKANTVADFMEAMEYIDLKEAELRAFSESADMETMEQYYEEAVSGKAEKKEGAIKRAWNAIAKLCAEIINKVKSLLGGKKVKNLGSGRVQTPKARKEIQEKIITFFKKWGNALSHPKSNPKAFAKAVAPLLVLVAGIAALKRTHVKGKKAETVTENASEIAKRTRELEKAAESLQITASEMIGLSSDSVEEFYKLLPTGTPAGNIRSAINSVTKDINSEILAIEKQIDVIDSKMLRLNGSEPYGNPEKLAMSPRELEKERNKDLNKLLEKKKRLQSQVDVLGNIN